MIADLWKWFITILNSIGPIEFLLGVLMFFCLYVFVQGHKDPSTAFNARHLIADPITEKVVLEKFLMLGAFLISSWGFVALVYYKLLTEWYFIGYMAAWASTRGIALLISKKGTNDGQAKTP